MAEARKAATAFSRIAAYGLNVLIGLGFLVTLGFMGYAGAGATGELHWWLAAGPVLAWVLFPYAVVAFTARHVDGAPVPLVLLLSVSVAVVASTVTILYSSFVIQTQGVRVFLILPVYQLLVWGPTAVAAYWLKTRSDKPDESTGA